MINLKMLLSILAIVAGLFVIITKNAIISVFNLIVLYILVAFYLIYIGITYLGISYIVVYVGAIAILFLFVIMMIDIEVVEKRSNNYLPLLFLLLCGFLVTLKNILFNIDLIKFQNIMKSSLYFEINKFKIWRENENEDFYYFYNKNLIGINEKNESNNLFNKWDINKYIDIYEEILPKLFVNKNDLYEYISSYLFHSYVMQYKVKETDFKENINLEDKNTFDFDVNSFIGHVDIFGNNYNNYFNKDINDNYLIILPDWSSAANRITQVSGIGDVLYTVYHSYIYILSIILLLGMVGAIILTTDTYKKKKIVNIEEYKKNKNNIIFTLNLIKNIYIYIFFIKFKRIFNKNINMYINKIKKQGIIIPFFSNKYYIENVYSEEIMDNLMYFILIIVILGLLLLLLNFYFSLSIKYLDKGGGFECGFTSFVQTRERFNVIFYRVSLLFLIFDLEIILLYPYPAIYQKNQNISKNNVLVFIYILVIGFIYELKEGALNIVKKAHSNEINNDIKKYM